MKDYLSVVIKPTLFCDTSCRHCYHTPEERVKGSMSLATVESIMKRVSEEYEAAWFIWHGGEPLTLPLSFYKEAIAIEEKCFGKGSFRCGNTIQTNGLNLNRRLMAYCRQKQINIGVSYEGPYNSVLREGDVSKAIASLSDKDNKYSASATISAETASHQKDIYRYFRDRKTDVSLSPVIPAGCAKCGGLVPDPDEFIKGSIEAFDDWLFDAGSEIPLIPHYLYVLNYLGEPVASDCAHTSCLTKWICVNPDGSVYPCAKACPPEFRMGNINEVASISELFRSEGFANILRGSIERREKCRDCEIYRYCGGGCSMDFYHECGIENNTGDSCRIYKEIFSHVASEIQKILDEKPDMSGYNRFVRDAIIGKLVNPKSVIQ